MSTNGNLMFNFDDQNVKNQFENLNLQNKIQSFNPNC